MPLLEAISCPVCRQRSLEHHCDGTRRCAWRKCDVCDAVLDLRSGRWVDTKGNHGVRRVQ